MGSYSCVCSIGYHLQNNLCIGNCLSVNNEHSHKVIAKWKEVRAVYYRPEHLARKNYNIIMSDLNECEESHGTVCGKNSMCVNSEGSYTCRCLDGFMGHNCTGLSYGIVRL